MTTLEEQRLSTTICERNLAVEALHQLVEEIEARPDQVPFVVTLMAGQFRVLVDTLLQSVAVDEQKVKAAVEALRRAA